MKLTTTHIDFLGTEIGQGKIFLQTNITSKIFNFPNKMEDTKTQSLI